MKALQVAPQLSLPLEAATETFGLLAVRGAGKSNAARVLAEEMFDAKIPFVAVDPFGTWWGLRASRDGEGPGIPVPLFGGKRGDVPLERGGGQLIADLIVDQRLSCVLDLSRFESESAKRGFLLDFARRLFERNEAPLHLFLEEADDYIPQKPMREEAQLIRAWQNIVRRGRGRGLGMTLITQRSASVSKEVLTQVQTLISMRTTGPQDTAAIAAWLKYHGQGEEILASLAGLEDGEAWVWSPNFLRKTVRLRFRLSRTYDSGATPKMQAAARAPSTLADIDLGAIKGRMADTIERAKAEDPRELRRRVAELERQLQAAGAAKPPASPPPAPRPAIDKAQLKRLEAAARELGKAALRCEEARAWAEETGRAIVAGLAAAAAPSPTAPERRQAPGQAPITVLRASPPPRRPAITGRAAPRSDGQGQIPLAQQRILNALAWLEAVGVRRPDKTQATLFAQLSPEAGYTKNQFGALRSSGLIDYPTAGEVSLTDAGRARSDASGAPQSAEEMQQQLMGRLPKAQRQLLHVLIGEYPSPLDKADVCARANLVHEAGYTKNQFGRLRSLGLIDYPSPGQVVAMPVLFLEAR